MSHSYYPGMDNIDLRLEFEQLLLGGFENSGIGRPVLIRRIRDEVCPCWDGLTGSPLSSCRYCQGEGFFFEETTETAYIARNFGSVLNPSVVISRQNFLGHYGYTDENRALAFMLYTAFPNYERYLKPEHPTYDKLYELKVDTDGNLAYPVTRVAKWKVKSVTPHHGDGGQIIYFELGLEKESV